MFKTLIKRAVSFWVTECTPNPGRSFPHWLAPKYQSKRRMPNANLKVSQGVGN